MISLRINIFDLLFRIHFYITQVNKRSSQLTIFLYFFLHLMIVLAGKFAEDEPDGIKSLLLYLSFENTRPLIRISMHVLLSVSISFPPVVVNKEKNVCFLWSIMVLWKQAWNIVGMYPLCCLLLILFIPWVSPLLSAFECGISGGGKCLLIFYTYMKIIWFDVFQIQPYNVIGYEHLLQFPHV